MPKKKFLELQSTRGYLRWDNDVTKTTDKVTMQEHGKDPQVLELTKTRPDEFFSEIKHIQDIAQGRIKIEDSPISLKRGVETMLVLAAAHKSYAKRKTMTVDYSVLN